MVIEFPEALYTASNDCARRGTAGRDGSGRLRAHVSGSSCRPLADRDGCVQLRRTHRDPAASSWQAATVACSSGAHLRLQLPAHGRPRLLRAAAAHIPGPVCHPLAARDGHVQLRRTFRTPTAVLWRTATVACSRGAHPGLRLPSLGNPRRLRATRAHILGSFRQPM